jgi:hypothetical protein
MHPMNNTAFARPLAIPGLVLLLVLLTGCSVRLPDLQLPPAAFGSEISLNQRLSVSALPGTTVNMQLDAQLEIDPARVQLAGFALGQRILTLSWDGEAMTSQRHPLLPAEIDEKRILRDIQLVYWPAAAIQAALPPGWTITDAPDRRALLFNTQTMVEIIYQAGPRRAGQAEFLNKAEHYRLMIESKETP